MQDFNQFRMSHQQLVEQGLGFAQVTLALVLTRQSKSGPRIGGIKQLGGFKLGRGRWVIGRPLVSFSQLQQDASLELLETVHLRGSGFIQPRNHGHGLPFSCRLQQDRYQATKRTRISGRGLEGEPVHGLGFGHLALFQPQVTHQHLTQDLALIKFVGLKQLVFQVQQFARLSRCQHLLQQRPVLCRIARLFPAFGVPAIVAYRLIQ